MSRIHDALRRGQRATKVPGAPRTPPADAVLAALGYRSEQSPRRRPLIIAALASLAVAVVASVTWLASGSVAIPPVKTPAPPPAGRGTGEVARSLPKAVRETVSAPQPLPPVAPVAVTTTTAETMPASTDVRAAPRESRPAPRVPPPAPRDVAAAIPAQVAQPRDAEFQLALYYQRSGDFERALVQYRRVLQRDELSVEAHNNLGMLYQAKGLYEDAAREFDRVIAIDPTYITAHLNLSAALLKLGRADAAAAQARAVLAIDPRHSDALVNLALAQEAAGQTGDAQLSLRRALEITPHHAAAHYNLAQVYDKAGDPALAVDHYRQFLQYAGPDQTAYVSDVRARIQALTRGTK